MYNNTFSRVWEVSKESIRDIDIMNNLYLPYFIEPYYMEILGEKHTKPCT